MMPLIETGEFMDRLETLGVSFTLDSERLVIAAKPGTLTAKDRAEVSQRWDLIERLVRSTVVPYDKAATITVAAAAVQLTMTEAA